MGSERTANYSGTDTPHGQPHILASLKMPTVPILMYHQIDTPPARGTPLRGLVVKPAAFARQMGLLRLLGWRGLAMRDLEPYISGEKTGKVVGITFDDGYRNNLEHALPVLLDHSFTATCYGVSALSLIHISTGRCRESVCFHVPGKISR